MLDLPQATLEESMPLFGRNYDDKLEKATEGTREGAGSPGIEGLRRQLEEERRQRLEDVHKERAERLAAQEEQRRLRKENSRLTRDLEEQRLKADRLGAARKGFFGALFDDKQGEDSSDGR